MNSTRDARPRRDATALVSPSRAPGAPSRSTSRGTVSAEGDMRTNSSRASARSPALTRTVGSMRPLRGDERDGFLRPCARAGRREVQCGPQGARERPLMSSGGLHHIGGFSYPGSSVHRFVTSAVVWSNSLCSLFYVQTVLRKRKQVRSAEKIPSTTFLTRYSYTFPSSALSPNP